MEYGMSLNKWLLIKDELALLQNKSFSEADTRCQIIDRLLIEVLAWPHENIRREAHTDRGYIDYILSSNENKIILEAKKNSIDFKLPKRKTFANSENLKSSSPDLYAAIKQARDYAREKQIPFCIVSNGLQLAICLTYPADKPNNDTIMLNGAESITDFFHILHDICSPYIDGYEILKDHLKKSEQLRSKPPFRQTIREATSPIEVIVEGNQLEPYLRPLIQTYFGEITDDVAKLDKLYCNTNQQNTFGQQIISYLRDRSSVIGFPVVPVDVTNNTASALSEKYKLTFQDPNNIGHVFLIVGNIGAGKSTFLARFYNNILDEHTRKRLIFAVINFLGYVDEDETLFDYINRNFIKILKDECIKRDIKLEKWSEIKAIYKDYVEELEEGFLEPFKGTVEFEQQLSSILKEKRQKEPTDYWARVIKYLKQRGIDVCIVMDNVDQLESKTQLDISMRAFKLAEEYKMLVIVTLRDETFWNLKSQLPMNAYKPTAYQIVPPSASKMIQRRLNVARTENPGRNIRYADNSQLPLTFNLNDFLESLENSLKIDEDDVFGQFSGGNMRLGLELFDTYLTAGHIEVKTYLQRLVKPTVVMRQEIIKSIGLGNLKNFNSSKTRMLNLFNLQDDGFYSHFTLLRILESLSNQLNYRENYEIGKGYVSISNLFQSVYPYCIDEHQLRISLIPLLQFFLVDSDIGARKMAENNHHEIINYVKITPTGLFYFTHLVSMATYLELVSRDTLITDQNMHAELIQFANKPHQKFRLVEKFLEFLTTVEENEFKFFAEKGIESKFTRLVPIIRRNYEIDKIEIQSQSSNKK